MLVNLCDQESLHSKIHLVDNEQGVTNGQGGINLFHQIRI